MTLLPLDKGREAVYIYSMPLKTVTGERATLTKGRGATLNPEGRFESLRRECFDDGWDVPLADEPTRPRTIVTPERPRASSRATNRPTSPLPSRSTLIAAASTVASTAMLVPVMRIWSCLRDWTSKRGCLQK